MRLYAGVRDQGADIVGAWGGSTPMSDVNTFTALETLRDRGAHYVLAAPDKRPLRSGWQKTPPDFEAVWQHFAKGGLVGVIPASLGAVVIDVDEGGPGGVQSVIQTLKPAEPSHNVEDPTGGWRAHLVSGAVGRHGKPKVDVRRRTR